VRVEVRALSIEYDGIEVVNDFAASFPSQRVSALVGPSGSGKSSILATIMAHRRPSRGEIIVTDASGESAPPTPALFAFVPQGANALPRRTALDNVLIGVLGRGERLATARLIALDALEAVALGGRSEATACHLSGGELQRLAFARALAMRRPILVADEPTANLDAASTRMVIRTIEQLDWPCTVIVATHDPDLEAVAAESIRVR
jgi:ABC-type lipoprotein export system ATPase subunit